MTHHSLSYYPDLHETNDPSLLVAFANLLRKYGVEASPSDLARHFKENGISDLTMASVTDFKPDLMPATNGSTGTWPTDNNSILCFRYLSPATGQAVNQYSLINNVEDHTIIDSADGKVKHPGSYGEPTGWTTYVIDTDDEEEPEEIIPDPPQEKYGTPYKLLPFETVWTLGRRFNISPESILNHNDLKHHSELQPGMTIYLPMELAVKDEKSISYELLPSPRPMHVSKQDGTYRYCFGNVRKWSDITRNGKHESANKNIDIVAIAHVPIGDDTAAYYMDANALGDYKETGRVKYNIGFNWQHLADGYAVAITHEPTVVEAVEDVIEQKKVDEINVREDIKKTLESIEPVLVAEKAIAQVTQQAPETSGLATVTHTSTEVDTITIPQPTAATLQPPLSYKNTYESYPDGPRWHSVYRPKDYTLPLMAVHGDNHRNFIKLTVGDEVLIHGTFMKGDVKYGAGVNKQGKKTWMGFPDAIIEPSEELYNTEMTIAEKQAMRKELKFDETLTVYLARITRQYRSLIDVANIKRKQLVKRR